MGGSCGARHVRAPPGGSSVLAPDQPGGSETDGVASIGGCSVSGILTATNRPEAAVRTPIAAIALHPERVGQDAREERPAGVTQIPPKAVDAHRRSAP